MEKEKDREKEKEKDPERTIPTFTTYPIADTFNVEPNSKITIPSNDEVTEAREWVNFNQK
ncbi:MAG: DUF3787 domain-containing protein [Eubacteriales bacterium]|nr:DUF3787 domain-containing protein [Eubacteriales bacterium]